MRSEKELLPLGDNDDGDDGDDGDDDGDVMMVIGTNAKMTRMMIKTMKKRRRKYKRNCVADEIIISE